MFLKELFIVMIHFHLITRRKSAATIQEIIAHRLNVVFGEAFHIRNTIVVYLDKIACDRSSGELISTCT